MASCGRLPNPRESASPAAESVAGRATGAASRL